MRQRPARLNLDALRVSWVLLFSALATPVLAQFPTSQTLPAFLGKPAPEFTLPDTEGRSHQLSDYRGKVVVLNFWATWCPPCREEMPAMERLHQLVGDENIAVVAINVGEDEDTIFRFTGDYPVTFPLLMDLGGRIVEEYPVIGLPTTYIIDPAGVIRHRAVGTREWDAPELVEELRALQRE
ncbi:MAG: TlpA family protein disulfide reductase [Gammaproteobacteria bacterium]|nr:TlpA family protein disulfide reductase [Gammaproteobacteria bacterium]